MKIKVQLWAKKKFPCVGAVSTLQESTAHVVQGCLYSLDPSILQKTVLPHRSRRWTVPGLWNPALGIITGIIKNSPPHKTARPPGEGLGHEPQSCAGRIERSSKYISALLSLEKKCGYVLDGVYFGCKGQGVQFHFKRYIYDLYYHQEYNLFGKVISTWCPYYFQSPSTRYPC